MSFLSVRALVIASNPHKESDRILRILTKEHGVVLCTASGAARSGSRFSFGSQSGILADFTLNSSHDYWYVKEIEVIEPFSQIHEDIRFLTAAAHLLEIARDVCFDPESSGEILILLVHAFVAMNSQKKDYRQIVATVEWRLMGILGYPVPLEPSLYETSGYAIFSFPDCRFYARGKCRIPEGDSCQTLSRSSLKALLHIQTSPVEKLFSFTVSEAVLDEITRLTHRYLCERLEKKYGKLEMLNHPWNLPEG